MATELKTRKGKKSKKPEFEPTTTTEVDPIKDDWAKLKEWANQKFEEHNTFVTEVLEKVKKPKVRQRLLKFIQTGKGKKAKKWVSKKKERQKMLERILHADEVMQAIFGKQ